MNYHNITTDDMLNGDGLRTVLWVSGCSHQCQNCQNPETWGVDSGIEFDDKAETELFEKLSKPHISGLTLSGGDPMHPQNRACIEAISRKAKELFPCKTIWLYTGCEYKDIKSDKIMNFIDIVVDGRYMEQIKNNNLHWRGSSNQSIIDVQRSKIKASIVLHSDGGDNVV